mmetsp:Transcript_48839/g.81168  ORF Transcript_48839/g.81168 Transcript_48839/m.81168 type:complete len:270 (-) Transcript_48839:248-1057(-)
MLSSPLSTTSTNVRHGIASPASAGPKLMASRARSSIEYSGESTEAFDSLTVSREWSDVSCTHAGQSEPFCLARENSSPAQLRCFNEKLAASISSPFRILCSSSIGNVKSRFSRRACLSLRAWCCISVRRARSAFSCSDSSATTTNFARARRRRASHQPDIPASSSAIAKVPPARLVCRWCGGEMALGANFRTADKAIVKASDALHPASRTAHTQGTPSAFCLCHKAGHVVSWTSSKSARAQGRTTARLALPRPIHFAQPAATHSFSKVL